MHWHSASNVPSQSDNWVEIDVFIELNYRRVAEDEFRSKPVGHRAPSPPNEDLPDGHYRGRRSRADHRNRDHSRTPGEQNLRDRHQSSRTAAGHKAADQGSRF